MKPNLKNEVAVFMQDDDDIPIEYAIYILLKVFGIDLETARIKCLACGRMGEVFVGRFSQKKADRMLNRARLMNMLFEHTLKFEIQED